MSRKEYEAMGIEHGKEQPMGIPYIPQREERPLFAAAVREHLVTHALGGFETIVRFEHGQRHKIPVPRGEELLSCTEAMLIRTCDGAKDVHVTVTIPCHISKSMASDPCEVTMRLLFKPQEWLQPHAEQRSTPPTPAQSSDQRMYTIAMCTVALIVGILATPGAEGWRALRSLEGQPIAQLQKFCEIAAERVARLMRDETP